MSLLEIACRYVHICTTVFLVIACIALIVRSRTAKKAYAASRAADQAVIEADNRVIAINEQMIETQKALIIELGGTIDGI